jgi:K+ transporter
MEMDRYMKSPGEQGSADAAAQRRAARDHKWPLPARILVAVALLPVWAAFLLAAEGDFSVVGPWFEPLLIALMVATVIVVWTTTARSQR